MAASQHQCVKHSLSSARRTELSVGGVRRGLASPGRSPQPPVSQEEWWPSSTELSEYCGWARTRGCSALAHMQLWLSRPRCFMSVRGTQGTGPPHSRPPLLTRLVRGADRTPETAKTALFWPENCGAGPEIFYMENAKQSRYPIPSKTRAVA